MTSSPLEDDLIRLDRRPYPAYKDLRGRSYVYGSLTFTFESIQGDPFASPSRLRIDVLAESVHLPDFAFHSRLARIATSDFLHRRVERALRRMPQSSGSGKSGRVGVLALGQEIVERSALLVSPEGSVQILLTVGLPAAGRRILGHAAADLLAESIPTALGLALHDLEVSELQKHVRVLEDQVALRSGLQEKGLIAFVADESILPRSSGVDEHPMKDAVAFVAPDSLAVTLETPHQGTLRGMGIREGITLIVGGGYHGKSTLLSALARGVYNHIPGDGRERVVTRDDAIWIRAEDGRSVESVDLRPFITNLPLGRDTACFSTEDASGSTSQAAAVVEAIQLGSRVLMIDEDIAATNFMIRDRRMRALVPSGQEPITPYFDRVEALHQEMGVSSVLVVGGAGDYLSVADTVIQMESYSPHDVTERAREIVNEIPSQSDIGEVAPWPTSLPRVPLLSHLDPRRGQKRERVRSTRTRSIEFGDVEIDVSLLEQLVDPAQARSIGDALLLASTGTFSPDATLREVVDEMDRLLEEDGIFSLCPKGFGDRARPRKYEIAAAFNRLRGLSFQRN